ncbi:MAG: hypothetical protein GF346_03930 [Candidatus Eisenbacteria bacterium]|nr:hypothetical protein [Candidatus Latescibacterota bacterium]MBD3301574.1 hypothetical protein [Candidatus Eisenbacteria bacterium]
MDRLPSGGRHDPSARDHPRLGPRAAGPRSVDPLIPSLDPLPASFPPLLLALALTVAATAAFIRLAPRAGFVAHPRADRYHSAPVPLLGGAAWLLGVGIAAIVTRSPSAAETGASLLPAAGVGIAGFFLVGLRDDRWPLGPLAKGILQVAVWGAVFAIWRPGGPLGHPLGLALAGGGAVVLINAWNYLDHADGVVAVVGGIAGSGLGLAVGAVLGEAPLVRLVWCATGGLLGFLVWNLPPARIFLGDSGSLPIGFVLVFAALVLIERGGPETRTAAAGAHVVPFADLLMVSLVRLRKGTNPLHGGREHTAHRLFGALGPTRSLLLLAAGTAGLAAFGLLFGPAHPVLGPSLAGGLAVAAALVVSAVPAPDRAPAPSSRSKKRERRSGKRSI